MSQAATPPGVTVARRTHVPKAAWAVLVAAAVAAAVALVLALSGGGHAAAPASSSVHQNPGIRYDGGPEEGTAGPSGHALDSGAVLPHNADRFEHGGALRANR
ncbi:MAG: hypothetical protein ACXVRH_04435 [Thermoleophilaceae bacterium]